MMTKYQFNQILTYFCSSVFVAVFVILCQNPILNNFQSAGVLLLLVLVEHYLLNLVHIGSHRALSKNAVYNDILGNLIAILAGVTLPVFRSTHNLHHAYPNDHSKDPDHVISTKGGLWWLPLRIFYHDYFFFTHGLYKQKNNFQIYLIDRLMQIGLVCGFWLNGKIDIWIFYWLPSILIIGFCYGLFQFYFPHYSMSAIDNWRRSERKNALQIFCIFAVDFSKYYHYKHHEKISSNLAYFPFWSYFRDHFVSKKKLNQMIQQVKY